MQKRIRKEVTVTIRDTVMLEMSPEPRHIRWRHHSDPNVCTPAYLARLSLSLERPLPLGEIRLFALSLYKPIRMCARPETICFSTLVSECQKP